MAAERNLVFVSYFAGPKNAVKRSCQSILTQLRPFTRRDTKFVIWERDQIQAGSNKENELASALRRCRVALVLMSSDYLASAYWETEAIPLVAAANAREIKLLWQQIEISNCMQEEIGAFQEVIPDSVLTKCSPSDRQRHEQRISAQVFNAWKEFAPLTESLSAVNIDEQIQAGIPLVPTPIACDAVALVIIPSGEDKGASLSYQWLAFIQKTGEDRFREIPNAEIGAEQAYVREQLPELLQRLQCWIDIELEDIPVLEIFASDDLLHEDWGSINIQEGKTCRSLHDDQPFLLRSADRLLNRRWSKRRGVLKRMHQHLKEGTGSWLPLDQLTKAEALEKLNGEPKHHEAGHAVVCALYSQQPSIFRSKPAWLRAMLKSMAPLVVWPSRTGALDEDQMHHCFRDLPLALEDPALPHKLGRPHCPDLTRLARARQQWDHPAIDLRGLTILVDHPDHAPDRTTLQTLFPSFTEDPSSPPLDAVPRSAAELLISP
jgi:hypothetical protein